MPSAPVNSVRAEQAVKLLASGEVKSKRQALRKVGYSSHTVDNQRPTQTQTWKRLMDKYMPDEKLSEVHSKGLEASKKRPVIVGRDEKGKPEYEYEDEDDYQARFKYLELAYKLKGRLTDNTAQQTNIQINNFNEKTSERISQAVTEELDKLIDV